MAYTRVWDETVPTINITPSNIIGVHIRNKSVDIRERVAGIFGMTYAEFQADPVVPKTLILGSPTVFGNRLSIKGDASNTEIITVDAPAGQTIDLMTWRVNGVVKADITATGALECTAIAFEVAGGLGTIAEPAGGAMALVAGAAGNGNLVFGAATASGHYFQYNGVTKHTFTTNTATFTGTVTATLFSGPLTGNLTGNVTGNLTGTILTAAQPNITSLGALTSLGFGSAGQFLTNAAATTGNSFMRLTSTGADVIWGAESSVGATIFTGSSAYAGVIGTKFATSLQLATNNTVRQTIDSAGNVVFTGTVTAANFVGPTTLDAINLTGTTLAANVVNSSLTNLGILTNLVITSASGVELTLGGAPTNNTTLKIGSSSVFGALGSTYSGGFEYLSHNAAYTAKNVDNWAQSLGSAASTILTVQPTGIVIYRAVAGQGAGTFATFWGAAIANISSLGFVGNLTGTVLTAAQGSITSLGTLTSLTVSGQINFARVSGLKMGTDDAGILGSATEIFIGDYSTATKGLAINFTNGEVRTIGSSRRLLVGTTDITGVGVGGIHAIGNSVFDGTLTFGANALQSTAVVGTRSSKNAFEWGHSNTAGYGSTIGHYVNGGNPFIAFNAEHGTNSDTFRTRGVVGSVLRGDIAGGFVFATIANANLDNQSPTTIFTLTTSGNATFIGTVVGITTLTATTINGTLATAAQANITSVGVLSSLSISGTGASSLQLNRTEAAAVRGYILLQRASGNKAGIGLNGSDQFVIFDSTFALANMTMTDAGAATFRAGVTATVFTGPLTGNVTGTVLTASQGSITSLGTLTSLAVSGLTATGTLTVGGGSTVNRILRNGLVWDAPSVAANGKQTTTMTVTGAVVGDHVLITPNAPTTNLIFTGYVSAANTVTIEANNHTGAAIDPISDTYYALVVG